MKSCGYKLTKTGWKNLDNLTKTQLNHELRLFILRYSLLG